MADIDINPGLSLKADVNKLYGDIAGTLAKYKEDRRYNKEAYNELLAKYAQLVTDIENIRNQLNELVETAQSNRLPDEGDIKAIDAIAGLMGAKKADGSLDLPKLISLGETFSSKKDGKS